MNGQTALDTFVWSPQPAAARFIDNLLETFLGSCPPAERLARRMQAETGTRLIDWLDYLLLPSTAEHRRQLAEFGFSLIPQSDPEQWQDGRGLFPTIVLAPEARRGCALRVESVSDFLAAHELEDIAIEGSPLAGLRKARWFESATAELWVVERHGAGPFEQPGAASARPAAVLAHAEAFALRRRRFERSEDGFAHARQAIDRSIDELGVDRTCDLFFAAERAYWQRRNRAGQVQRARQDRLGLGWANHDHHTYRSSREHFTRLIGVFEQLGFECRERFYGGRDAGWGAQVLEQPACGVVIFADVDLSADEVSGDFAHEPLAPRERLGTVGLWCRLHGEAFLEAGMHHLECRFDFDLAREQLRAAGIETMKPFTEFEFLRQAFTQADYWPVDPQRIAAAQAAQLISSEQADHFRQQGALGSHLEILERNDGYKGFNQTGISEIIRDTDPRRQGR